MMSPIRYRVLPYRVLPGLAATLGVAGVMLAPIAGAQAASSRIARACTADAHRLCPRDKKDSPSLRYCMEAKGHYLSRACKRALEDDGTIPRGYFD